MSSPSKFKVVWIPKKDPTNWKPLAIANTIKEGYTFRDAFALNGYPDDEVFVVNKNNSKVRRK